MTRIMMPIVDFHHFQSLSYKNLTDWFLLCGAYHCFRVSLLW